MLTDEYRYKILQLLERNPHASQRELAKALGISLGRMNYCLNALMERGLVKVRNFTSSRNRRAYMYYLTPRGMKEKVRVTVRFFKQRVLEYEALQREIETLRHEAARENARLQELTGAAGCTRGAIRGAPLDFIDLKAQYRALRDSINARIQKVLDHGQYIMGPEVAELEQRLAAFTGVRHCVTVASGTEALLIALMALDIKPGDEVITPSFTFVATAEVIVLAGAKPVFVDIEPDTYNIDAAKIEALITPRTKAIMPVSLYGQVSDMDEINAIAARYGLPVIEDAAQSFGATYRGRKSCGLSTIGCTSFFPSKPLACYGDGGAIFTDDDALARAMREIREHGQSARYVHTRIGVGGRMDTLQCAVVLGKLERFEWEVEQRMRIGARYTELLGRIPGITLPIIRPDRTSVYAQYTIQVDDRDRLQKRLAEQNIPTAVHYPIPLTLQPAYKHLSSPGATPIAEQVARRVVSLPMHAYLDEATQDRIVEAVRQASEIGSTR